MIVKLIFYGLMFKCTCGRLIFGLLIICFSYLSRLEWLFCCSRHISKSLFPFIKVGVILLSKRAVLFVLCVNFIATKSNLHLSNAVVNFHCFVIIPLLRNITHALYVRRVRCTLRTRRSVGMVFKIFQRYFPCFP